MIDDNKSPDTTDDRIVTIDIGDGVEREIRFNMRKLRELKKRFGASLLRGAALLNIDEDQLPVLIHVGMEGDDKPSVAKIEELIDMRSVPKIMRAIARAWVAATPKEPGQVIEDLNDALARLAAVETWMEEEKARQMQLKATGG